jgi:integrase/recombinase XerD
VSIPLATLATQFLERPGLAKTTIRSYESVLLPLLQNYGAWSIEVLTRSELIEYLNGLSHLSYTTHHKHQAIVQALFNFAVEQGYVSVNPIVHLKRRKPDSDKGEHGSDQRIRYLTPIQLQCLEQAVASDCRLHTLVKLLHRTGARISEILALNLCDLDLEQCKFQVVGKGNRQRMCFYSEDAAILLKKYLRCYRHSQCPALFTAENPLTKSVRGWGYRSVYQHWCDLTQPYPELENIRLHDLRHTFATERVGVMSLEELRALMGHQNIQTTLHYQKVTSQKAEAAAQRAFTALLR